MSKFVHLHTHSEYSVNHSLIKIKKLIAKTQDLEMGAVALTDNTNTFAAIKFYSEATSQNIKPIFGATINLENRGEFLLLCLSYEGFLNLSKIISQSYLKPQGIEGVLVEEEILLKFNQGFILIDVAVEGVISTLLLNKKEDEAHEVCKKYKKIFSNRFYFAIQRINKFNDEKQLHSSVSLATTLDIPVVATNAVNFLEKEDFEAHEARVCIADGGLLDDDKRVKKFTPEQYLKSEAEMLALFSDIPEALENTVEIAKRCNVKFKLNEKNYLPNFEFDKKYKTVEDFFTVKSNELLERFLKKEKIEDKKTYQDRLNFELEIINKMKFPGYFLIVADFIAYAKEQKIPVGPGRGSGAGSLVAFVLGITNVDPLKFDLLFERFLNPERVSMPDFDIDFCTSGRDEVIRYVSEKYGQEKVSQIITYGTMAAKGVIRDVGRVLGHPYGFCDKLSKLIPNDLKMTLDKALDETEELKNLYDSDESVKSLFDLARKLEGLVRNVGTHAGGVVIAPSQISDFCPIYKGSSEEDVVVSQFDKDDLEAIGLVKFDFLGLSNLTTIDKTVQTIKHYYDVDIDLDNLTLDDKKTYKLFQKADTTGIFQLESEGMRQYLKKLHADNFDDIVDMLALYRPGSMEYIDDYIAVKHGQKVQYPHPLLEEVLQPTNGVFVYQEQVMKTAQIVAGYSLGGADLLRRAMGKKKKEEMAQQRSVFVEGAAKNNNINEAKANELFDYIDKFAGYGFNKSHSVAYALISYQTAWLKSHYPAAFMAALLSSMMGDNDKIPVVVKQVAKMGLTIEAPNVSESFYNFTIKNDTTLYYGLGAVKGVGKNVVEAIVNFRKEEKITGFFEFCASFEWGIINRRGLEALIVAGAFDFLNIDRAILTVNIETALKEAQRQHSDKIRGQSSLFGESESSTLNLKLKKAKPWAELVQLHKEKEALGFYFSYHPVDIYQEIAKSLRLQTPTELSFRNNREVRLIGLLADIRYRNLQKGQMAHIVLEDGQTQVPVVIFSKQLIGCSENLIVNSVVVIEGTIRKDFRDEWQLVANTVELIDAVKLKASKNLSLVLDQKQQKNFPMIAKTLKQHHGNCPVKLQYQTKNAQGELPLSYEWNVKPDDELLNILIDLLSKEVVKVDY